MLLLRQLKFYFIDLGHVIDRVSIDFELQRLQLIFLLTRNKSHDIFMRYKKFLHSVYNL